MHDVELVLLADFYRPAAFYIRQLGDVFFKTTITYIPLPTANGTISFVKAGILRHKLRKTFLIKSRLKAFLFASFLESFILTKAFQPVVYYA